MSPRRILRIAAFASLVAATTHACTSFSGDSDTPPAEAGADVAPPPPPPPGPPPADGGACDLDATILFDNFDDPGLTAWDMVFEGDGAVVAVTDAASFSPPASLRTAVTPDPDGGTFAAGKQRGFSPRVQLRCGTHLEARVLPVELPSGSIGVGPALSFVDDTGRITCGYYFIATPNTLELALQKFVGDAGSIGGIKLDRKLQVGVWNDVALDFSTGDDGGVVVSATIDGMPALAPTAVTSECAAAKTIVQTTVGLVGITALFAQGDAAVQFDDYRLGGGH